MKPGEAGWAQFPRNAAASPGGASDAPHFRINLIADRAARLRRRRRLEMWCAAAAFLLLGASAWLLTGATRNMIAVLRSGVRIDNIEREIRDAKRERADLDRMRDTVTARIAPFAPLAPIARNRVAWAPKLDALSSILPAGMGVAKVDAYGGDAFAASRPADGTASAKSSAKNRSGRRNEEQARMVFSIVSTQAVENPIEELRDRLRESAPFMDKMARVHVEATEESCWEDTPVVFFRCLVQAEAREP